MDKSSIFANLSTKLDYLPDAEYQVVQKAYDIAYDAHISQKRMTGEPYIVHPVAVATILANLKLDYEAISAALLHDVIEDTHYTHEDLLKIFDTSIVNIVEGVSKLDKLKFRTREEAQAASFQKMMLAMAQDLRTILIKLADRMHNMATLDIMPPSKKRRIAKETLEIYSPIAGRLSIYEMKRVLDELSFKAYYPYRYKIFTQAIEQQLADNDNLIKDIRQKINAALQDNGIQGYVLTNRPTEPYYIYQYFCENPRQKFKLMDFYLFKIVTTTQDECYRVLGIIHTIYKPKVIKDYIALPKLNTYQAIHSTVVIHDYLVRFIIQTSAMNDTATYGILEYWNSIKNKTSVSTSLQEKSQSWLHDIINLQSNSLTSTEFLEGVKLDLFAKEIFVFTPRGRIYKLPKGATVLDFAYNIHTEVGRHTAAGVVNKNLVSPDFILNTGDTVEVKVDEARYPTLDQLKYVKTARTKLLIRQYFRDKYNAKELFSIGMKKIWQNIPKNIQARFSENDLNVAFSILVNNNTFLNYVSDYALNIEVEHAIWKIIEDTLDNKTSVMMPHIKIDDDLTKEATEKLILNIHITIKYISNILMHLHNILDGLDLKIYDIECKLAKNQYAIYLKVEFTNAEIKDQLSNKIMNAFGKDSYSLTYV